MKNIANENYIVIHGWMINDLELKGNELLVYAIVYGFSQTKNQWFTGNRQYIADWIGSTKRSVQNHLNSLVDKGLLDKKIVVKKNVKEIQYKGLKPPLGGEKISSGVGKNFPQGGEKISSGVGKNFPQGGEKISPNNNTNNNTNNKLNIYIALIDSYTQNDDLKRALINLVEMRQKQKGFTVHALELILKKLDKLSERDDTKIEIINNTVMNSWKGIYPIKNKDDVPDWFKDTKQEAADPVLLEQLQEIQQQKQAKGPIQ